MRRFRELHEDELRNPAKAKAYVNVALEEFQEDNDSEALLLALRDVAEAQGGLGVLAEKTGLNRSNIYKALSESGNPRIDTVGTILRGLGLRLSVDHIQETRV